MKRIAIPGCVRRRFIANSRPLGLAPGQLAVVETFINGDVGRDLAEDQAGGEGWLTQAYPLANLGFRNGSVPLRVVNGGVLTGSAVDDAQLGLDCSCQSFNVLEEMTEREVLAFVQPGFEKRSYSNTFASFFKPIFKEKFTTALRGEARYVQRLSRGFLKQDQPLDPSIPLRLESKERGILDSLKFSPFVAEKPGPGEVLIRVDAAGMNFRDVLKALALVPEASNSSGVRAGITALLEHWEHQTEYKLKMFGIGTDFRKLKYPFVWYDILHVADVLSRYPQARADPRFAEIVGEITSQADEQGRYRAGSMYRAWQDSSFADKQQPSPWLTLLVLRIQRRLGAVSANEP